MPEPGEGDDALGQEVEQFVVAAEGSGPSVSVPVGFADDLVDAVTFSPARRSVRRRDRRHARAPCRDTWHGPCRAIEDGAGIADVLAAGDGDEGSLGQVRLGLAILARAQEVPCVDGGGGQRPVRLVCEP